MGGLKLSELLFLVGGLKWTILLAIIGLGFGAVAGLVIALARTSHSTALRRATGTYIAVFQGTPLLM